MRYILKAVLLLISTALWCQENLTPSVFPINEKALVLMESVFKDSPNENLNVHINALPDYRYQYKYSKLGLKKVELQRFVNNLWMNQESRNYDMDEQTGLITCVYKKSSTGGGALDFDAIAEQKRKPKVIDTIRLAQGKIIYRTKFDEEFEGNYHFKVFHYKYDSAGKLIAISSQKRVFYIVTVSDKPVLKFKTGYNLANYSYVYKADILDSILVRDQHIVPINFVLLRMEGKLIEVQKQSITRELLESTRYSYNGVGQIEKVEIESLVAGVKKIIETRKYKYNMQGAIIEYKLRSSKKNFTVQYTLDKTRKPYVWENENFIPIF